MDLSDNNEEMASSLLEITIPDSDQDSLQSPNSTTSQTERDYECLICFYPFYSKSLTRETDEKICICPSCASTYHQKCIQAWSQSQKQKSSHGVEYYGCPKCKYQGELLCPEDGSGEGGRAVRDIDSGERDSLDISISECPSPSAGDRVSSNSKSSDDSNSSSESAEGVNGSLTDRRSDYGVSSVSSDGMESRYGESSRTVIDEPEECECNNGCCLFTILFFGAILWLSVQK